MEKWYWFWKKVQGHLVVETYKLYNEKYTNDEIQDFCEEWLYNINEDYGTYEYNFQEVEKPSKKWLENKIDYNSRIIKNTQNENKIYYKILNEYYLKDKIEKIKNNIN
jgi:hypothetical protein